MENIEIAFEVYEQGYMIIDYSNASVIRYCGSGFYWNNVPIIDDPFVSLEIAKSEASKYFTGK